jgi:uncharacterized protein
MSNINEFRRALISVLAARSKGGCLGRTALMKYMYLLQTLRGVPLGYRFTLYSYGPFDSEVLSDLSVAEALEAVESEVELYSGGYGYRIRPAQNAKWLEEGSEKLLKKYEKDIGWVIRRFGSFNSAELELVGTIIYVDREARSPKDKIGLNQIAMLVHEVKPHFTTEKVLQYARRLADESILRASA